MLKLLLPALWVVTLSLPVGARVVRAPEAVVARAALEGSVRVIVELAVPILPEGRLGPGKRLVQRQAIGAAHVSLLDELGALSPQAPSGYRAFKSIPFAAMKVGPEALAALENSSWIVGIQEDRLLSTLLSETVPIVQADQAWSLGFDGTGQNIVIIDTGITTTHVNFAGQIADEACFALGVPSGSGDCPNGATTMFGAGAGIHCSFAAGCNHGTHVGGIAGGDGVVRPGVAKGAGLISVQVFSEFSGAPCSGAGEDPCELAYTSDIIDALEHVYDTLRFSYTIAAVNMSLGGANYSTQAACDAANAATKAAIDNLRSVEIATVVAAGNDSETTMISEPACISTAISVGATDDVDEVADFSNAASFLTLWAPGYDLGAPKWMTSNKFISFGGTSQASPHVAGALAILREVSPAATIDEMIEALQATGQAIEHPEANTPRIRVLGALLDLQGIALCFDGFDNDGDGLTDYPDDTGCRNLAASSREDPECQDGIDNDGDGQTDAGDAACAASPSWWDNESSAQPPPSSSCGLGAELSLLLLVLGRLSTRRRRR